MIIAHNGKPEMDLIRRIVAEMSATERTLLEARTALLRATSAILSSSHSSSQPCRLSHASLLRSLFSDGRCGRLKQGSELLTVISPPMPAQLVSSR